MYINVIYTSLIKKHVNSFKYIWQYLLATRDKGTIYTPTGNLTDTLVYIDADFCGTYNKSTPEDPNGYFSWTWYIVFFNGCPIIWKSKLQTVITLSTTEAEYIALSHSTRDLIPFR